jgi:hypothetical protein
MKPGSAANVTVLRGEHRTAADATVGAYVSARTAQDV